eukprot:g17392.t1
MGHFDVIVAPTVQFFRRGDNFEFSRNYNPKRVTVLTMAMYNRNPCVHKQPRDAPDGRHYIYGVERKFRTLFEAAEQCRVRRLVMCDIGCGVYKNDPVKVGQCLGRVISGFPFQSVEEIVISGSSQFFEATEKIVKTLDKESVTVSVGVGTSRGGG